MSAHTFGPIPGSTILSGIAGKKAIIMAATSAEVKITAVVGADKDALTKGTWVQTERRVEEEMYVG